MPKKHRMGGKGFFDSLMKGVNFIKDNGLASKALGMAGNIAGALGKQGIADKLNTGAQYATAFGAGRRRKHHKKGTRKMTRYSTRSPTMKAEFADIDNNNRLSGNGRRRKMHGRGLFDMLGPLLSAIGGGRRHHGGALNLAGRGLGLAGGGAEMHNYSQIKPFQIHHGSHNRKNEHMHGTGLLGRVNNRGLAKMQLK